MTINLQVAISIIMLIFLFIIVKNIKNKKLQLSFSIFWIVIGTVFIIIMIIPNCLNWLTKIIGFEVTSNMIFFIALSLSFYLILKLMVSLSNENKRNNMLVQEISIMDKKIRELNKEKNDE